jgi:hypothetical protein
MILAALNLILDLAVLCGLGVGLYYALRLMKLLEVFRSARSEMGAVMSQLVRAIDDAQRAIDSLKSSGTDAAQRLQKNLSDGKALAQELELMNAAGNSLAQRLERLADKTRQRVNEEEGHNAQRASSARSHVSDPPAFFIKDREVENEDVLRDDPADTDHDQNFKSQAERELYEALQSRGLGRGQPR